MMTGHSLGAYQLRYHQSAAAQALDHLAEQSIRMPGNRSQNQRRIDLDIANVKHQLVGIVPIPL